MGFRGLFIGIDQYASPDVNELRCARRDAVALEALFADTLGGAATLLIRRCCVVSMQIGLLAGAQRLAAKSERRTSTDLASEEGRGMSSICVRSTHDGHRSKADAVRRSRWGSSGPIRGVAARTSDLLPAAARVAEILHPSLDLSERAGRLVLRLTYNLGKGAQTPPPSHPLLGRPDMGIGRGNRHDEQRRLSG